MNKLLTCYYSLSRLLFMNQSPFAIFYDNIFPSFFHYVPPGFFYNWNPNLHLASRNNPWSTSHTPTPILTQFFTSYTVTFLHYHSNFINALVFTTINVSLFFFFFFKLYFACSSTPTYHTSRYIFLNNRCLFISYHYSFLYPHIFSLLMNTRCPSVHMYWLSVLILFL